MKKIFQLLTATFAISTVIGIVISIFGWFASWDSATQFSDGFSWASAILITIGSMSILGGFKMRNDGALLYSQSAGDMNTYERGKLWLTDTMQGYQAFILFLLTWIYLILYAILIANIFS